MSRNEFQAKIIDLWTKSRVPFTQTNLKNETKIPDKTLNTWLDELLDSGDLDIKVNGTKELEYVIPTRPRPHDGPTTLEEYHRKRQRIAEAKRRIIARRTENKPTSSPALSPPPPKSTLPIPNAPSHEQITSGREDGDKLISGEESSMVSTLSKVAIAASGKALVALDKPLAMLDKPVHRGDKNILVSAGLSLLGPIGWLYSGSFREAIPATMAYIALGAILPSFVLTPFVVAGSLLSSAVGATYAWQFNRNKKRTPLLLPEKTPKKKDK